MCQGVRNVTSSEIFVYLLIGYFNQIKLFNFNKNVVNRVAKTGFLRGSAKIEQKISCEDFYTLFMLNHQSQAHSVPTPPTPNTYSYLPFENSKFMVVRECNKEYQSQICNFISKNRLITYC